VITVRPPLPTSLVKGGKRHVKYLISQEGGVMPPSSSEPLPVSLGAVGNRKRKKDQVKAKEIKKTKVEKNLDVAATVHRLTRTELEELVLKKVVEAVTAKSKYAELIKKFEKMSEDFGKMKEKASSLQKHLSDLKEVTKRIKVMENTQTVRIPKVTRSVGLQVTSKFKSEQERQQCDKAMVIEIDDENTVPAEAAGSVFESIKSDSPLNRNRKARDGVARKSGGGGKSLKTESSKVGGKTEQQNEMQMKDSEAVYESEPLNLTVAKSSSTDGIVITWAKRLDSLDVDSIVNYELEGSKGVKSEKMKWTRIGNLIQPLPLPMACNLNKFKQGINYHFRVKLLTKEQTSYSNISSIVL